MNIGSISGSAYSQSIQRAPESSEAKGMPDRDGDSDDASQAVKAAPSVNTSGQSVGNVINTKA